MGKEKGWGGGKKVARGDKEQGKTLFLPARVL